MALRSSHRAGGRQEQTPESAPPTQSERAKREGGAVAGGGQQRSGDEGERRVEGGGGRAVRAMEVAHPRPLRLVREPQPRLAIPLLPVILVSCDLLCCFPSTVPPFRGRRRCVRVDSCGVRVLPSRTYLGFCAVAVQPLHAVSPDLRVVSAWAAMVSRVETLG